MYNKIDRQHNSKIGISVIFDAIKHDHVGATF